MTQPKRDPDAIDRIVEELMKRPSKPIPTAHLEDVTYTQTISIYCKYCGSKNVVKNGSKGDIQYYLCRDCNHTFAGNNALPGMRYPPDRIATALRLFYEGLSLDKIRRELDHLYSVYPSDSTVYEWVTRYTKAAIKEAKYSNIKVGSVWIADETVLILDKDVHVWFFDIIDDSTRFLLASHLAQTRIIKAVQILMQKAVDTAGRIPRIIYTDKLASYLEGIELTFGSDTKHVQSSPFEIGNSNNFIERFHSTLKSRTEIMRGMQNPTTADLIMNGWLIYYNFFRPHDALRDLPPKGLDKTPAQVAKADYPYKSWYDVVMGK